MATKTISITEEAYDRLLSRKKEKESFTEVINRITNKMNLLDFSGILNKKEGDRLEKSVLENRRRSRRRMERIREELKIR